MANLQDVRYTFKNIAGATHVRTSTLPGGVKKSVPADDTIEVAISIASTLSKNTKKFQLVDVRLVGEEVEKEATKKAKKKKEATKK